MDTLLVFIAVLLGSIGSSESQLRLAGGNTPYEGRVEIFLDGGWGTVCDDYWNLNNAEVVCRQLGFYSAIAAPRSAYFGEGSVKVVLDNVDCSGNEALLVSCRHSRYVDDCGHDEDAGVVCKSAPYMPYTTTTTTSKCSSESSPQTPNLTILWALLGISLSVNFIVGLIIVIWSFRRGCWRKGTPASQAGSSSGQCNAPSSLNDPAPEYVYANEGTYDDTAEPMSSEDAPRPYHMYHVID